MKALTIGGAMIDTIAIIEGDRIDRVSMLNAETSSPQWVDTWRASATAALTAPYCPALEANVAGTAGAGDAFAAAFAAYIALGKSSEAALRAAAVNAASVGRPCRHADGPSEAPRNRQTAHDLVRNRNTDVGALNGRRLCHVRSALLLQ
jgi:hypothetical protein